MSSACKRPHPGMESRALHGLSVVPLRRIRTLIVLLAVVVCPSYALGELETHLRRTPPSDLRGRSATFTLTSASAKWGYEVQLDDEPGWTLGPAFVADATTGAVTGLVSAHRVLSHTMNCVSPGPHTLRVRTFDAAGVRAQPASAEWTQHAPMATLAVGMPPRVNPGADHWVEVRSDGAKYAFELRVDDGDWVLGDAYAPAAAKKAAAAAAAVGGVGGRSSGAGGAEMGLSKFTESPRMERQRVRAGAEGRHALEVRALDECGNRGEPVRSEWVSSWVSTVVVEAAPDGEALFADSASFAAKGDTPHYFVEHSLDDGAWVRSRKMSSAATAAPVRVQLAGLSEGRHTLVVRALDAQGRAAHVSQQARFAWAVDRQPPVTRVGDGGARRERDVGLGMAAEAMVTVVPYDVTDATECTVEYQLGSWAPTEWKAATGTWGRLVLRNLPDGEHTLRLRATDAAGNVERAPPEVVVGVDSAPPTTSLASGPDRYTAQRHARFWLAVSERGSRLEYSVDGAPFQPTSEQLELTDLADGRHTLHVHSVDDAGNRERRPLVYVWTVDTVAPSTALHAGWGTAERPRMAVSATPGVGESWDSFVYTFMYRVDDGEWVEGSKAVRLGPGYEVVLEGLAPGVHTLTAVALDLAGNADPSPAVHSFVVPHAHDSWHAQATAAARANSAAFLQPGHPDLVPTMPGEAWLQAFERGEELSHPAEEEERLRREEEEGGGGWFGVRAPPRRVFGSRAKLKAWGELRR